ncbi:MAG: glycine cleavage system aminomethyltransferase GcvT [Bacteroidota bacterium]
MKHTPLENRHVSLGAKMVDFAGFYMPVSYAGINEEHATVRNQVGVFDVSHMGEFILEGENALALIQKVTSNDASKLIDNQAQYSCMPNKTGGIVDDLLVYRIHATKYLLVVNASNIDKDWNWISSNNDLGVQMTNVSDDYCLLAIQGPKAIDALQSLTEVNLSDIAYYHFRIGTFAGIDNAIISATGYTGAGGFEIYAPTASAEKLWDAVFEAGAALGIKPIGLGARDTLRLEMGFCLYGNDINDTTNPLEAGLGWITKLAKPDFNGKSIMVDLKEKGIAKKLVGFEMIERGIPRHDYEICDEQGNTIGVVTSGTQSPSLNKAIGMGYVTTALAKEGSKIFIKIRDKNIAAQVVKIPFYKAS